ncbi:MAG: thiamine pyrophosphate-dependent enzyme, partial [Thermoanaerobaculia bacterium]|nr:thiamine pyrophosphate-dependent enzyme [Thermoanaerobaculia bacterium]
NTMSGLYEAQFGSSPVLLVTGQTESAYYGKGKGFLHENERQLDMLRSVTGGSTTVARRADVASSVVRAGIEAQRGRPGPRAVEIPIDLQYAVAEEPEPRAEEVPRQAPDPGAVETAAAALAASRRRVILAGGGVVRAGAAEPLRALAARLEAPVFTSVNGRGSVDETGDLAMGVLQGPPLGGAGIHQALASAEMVLAVGTRFQSAATGVWSLEVPSRLLHLDADAHSIGLNYRPEVAIVGDAGLGLQAILDAYDGAPNDAAFNRGLLDLRDRHRAELRRRIGPDHQAVMETLRRRLPASGNLVRDATVPAYTWGNQLFPILAPRTSIHPTSSAIGPGLPFAIGAAVGSGETTFLLQGDGGFMLSIGELATAAQYRLPILICLFNDGGYGVLRAIQAQSFEGRMTGVDLHTPDFVSLAEAMGLQAERVSAAADLDGAVGRALDAGGPALIDIDLRRMRPIEIFGAATAPPAGDDDT